MKTDGKVENISYTLLYRRGCHHITVRVTSNGTVSVSAPYGISKAAVERVIISNQEKLLTTIEKQRNTLHSFQDGEIFFYAGKPYTLTFLKGACDAITVKGSSFLVSYTAWPMKTQVVCNLIKELYRKAARERIVPLLSYWAEALHLAIPSFSVRDSKSRWGSCSAKGRLSFSLRCQILDDKQLSYLVLHEMAHVIHFNHSREFHALLFYHMSDYKQVQKSIFSLQQESQLCH